MVCQGKNGPGPGETAEAVGPFLFLQKKKGFKITRDPLLLVDFVITSHIGNGPAIDLGAGSGIIPLMLAWKTGIQKIAGIEINDEQAELAQRNVLINKLGNRVEIFNADYRDLPEKFKQGSFPIVISNPPYVKAGAGRKSPDKYRSGARSEEFGSLDELVSVAGYLCGTEGRAFFIYPVPRLFEMLARLSENGLFPKTIRFLRNSREKAARLFLVEALGRPCSLNMEEGPYD